VNQQFFGFLTNTHADRVNVILNKINQFLLNRDDTEIIDVELNKINSIQAGLIEFMDRNGYTRT
jgi:hypothetical protein